MNDSIENKINVENFYIVDVDKKKRCDESGLKSLFGREFEIGDRFVTVLLEVKPMEIVDDNIPRFNVRFDYLSDKEMDKFYELYELSDPTKGIYKLK